jgi:hypothetical protein
MRKILVAALIAAAIIAVNLAGGRADAMPVAAPAQLGLAAADATPMQQVRWHGWHARPDRWGRRWYWGWPVPWFHFPRWHWGGWGWHHHYHHWHHR